MSDLPKWIVFAAIIFISVAGNRAAEAIENLDMKNPGPNLWNQMQKEMADREATRTKIGFYAMGKETIEMRAVADPADGSEVPGFQWMTDRKGKRLQVAEKAEIDSDDIYGILIEKTMYRGQEEYTVTLHFKQDSWNKVNDVSRKYLKKQLAVVRGGVLLSAPMMQEAVVSAVQIASEFDSGEIDEFKKGFVLLHDTALEAWHQISIEWLEERNRQNPNDLAIMSWLAREHYASKPRNCKRSLPLYESLLQNKSVRGEHLDNLQMCYTELGQYERAAAFYEGIAPLYKDEDELAIRTQLAQIYIHKGDGQKAVVELDKCLQIAKGLPLPSFDHWDETSQTRMLNEVRAMKEKTIQHQEELIKKVRAYFNLDKP